MVCPCDLLVNSSSYNIYLCCLNSLYHRKIDVILTVIVSIEIINNTRDSIVILFQSKKGNRAIGLSKKMLK